MPRVNRDLERRLAARRQREPRRATGSATRSRLVTSATMRVEDDRGARADAPLAERTAARPQRPAARPFSDYGKEYAYVVRDLRRIAVVVGGLLVFVIALAALLRV